MPTGVEGSPDEAEAARRKFWGEMGGDSTVQDWEYCTAKAGDLGKYFDFYFAWPHDIDETHTLLMFILQAANDGIRQGTPGIDGHLERLTAVVGREAPIHGCLFDYWCSWQDENPKHWWALSRFLRQHHLKLALPLSQACEQCRHERTFRSYEADT
jgi:hypothetical protein